MRNLYDAAIELGYAPDKEHARSLKNFVFDDTVFEIVPAGVLPNSGSRCFSDGSWEERVTYRSILSTDFVTRRFK